MKQPGKKELQAIGLLATNPNLTIQQIAKKLGINRTSLYRFPVFGALRKRMSEMTSGERPSGDLEPAWRDEKRDKNE